MENGRQSMTDLLKEWLENKDRGSGGRRRLGMLVGAGVGLLRVKNELLSTTRSLILSSLTRIRTNSYSHTLANTPLRGTLHPENPFLLLESILSIPPPIAKNTIITDKMEILNHLVYPVANANSHLNEPLSQSSASSTPSTSSASPPPAPGTISLPSSPRFNLSHLSSSLPESSPLADQHRPRMASDTSSDSPGPSATDSLAEHVRNRYGSGSRCAFEEDNGAEGSGRNTPPSRQGILLRNHHCASSSSQSHIQGASFRALRFESSSSTSSLSAKARYGVIRAFGVEGSLSPPRVMQKSNSASSLIVEGESGQEANESLLVPDFPPATIVDFEDATYVAPNRAEDGRTSERLLLYIIFILFISKYVPGRCNTVQEFPFSINQPPPTEIRDGKLLTVPYSCRGERAKTASEAILWNATTATSSVGSGSMMTLATSNDGKEYPCGAPADQHSSFGLRRSHIPTNIDICSISSHAPAEALVQRAQQSNLDMEDIPDDNPLIPGRLPLSAKLVAYGESLALERRLKRMEEGMNLSRGEQDAGYLPVIAVFMREPSKKTASPRVRDTRVLEGP
ncbi:hypothetical protein PILCRDRAFT_15236 [Piloderma croceum F 1598]|uniref:Ig-like domain-containing protein n=1 Tax=Piloderma croceum (strain F 1598) TaxID=765440 RepID=A0A0C3ELH6_PILCF|nr:hypothetical protein PILCRDRAFT_15236 [Piloderma croceum F 1598]